MADILKTNSLVCVSFSLKKIKIKKPQISYKPGNPRFLQIVIKTKMHLRCQEVIIRADIYKTTLYTIREC